MSGSDWSVSWRGSSFCPEQWDQLGGADKEAVLYCISMKFMKDSMAHFQSYLILFHDVQHNIDDQEFKSTMRFFFLSHQLLQGFSTLDAQGPA